MINFIKYKIMRLIYIIDCFTFENAILYIMIIYNDYIYTNL